MYWVLVVCMVWLWICIGMDCYKFIVFVFIGDGVIIIIKVWIKWCEIGVFDMVIVVIGICLLNFD